MAIEKVIIQVGSQADLDSTIKKLQELGAIDEKNAKAFQAHSKDTQTAIDSNTQKLGGFQKALANIGPVLAGAFAVSNLISLGKEILDTTAKFQKFDAVLTNTLGSKSAAQKALKEIADFAATTPFQVDEITDSFIKLANRGVKLTGSQMTSIGDVAASLGKDFGQVVEAIADVNNTERWNEIGIKATTVGNKVSLAFKGTTIEVDKTVAGVTSAIEKLGKLNGVAGTTAAVSATLGGQISNLADTYTSLLLVIGNKLAGAFSGGITAISNGINILKDLIADTAQESSIFTGAMDFVKMSISNLLAPLKEFFNVLTDIFETVFKPIGDFLSAVFVPIIEAVQKAFGGAGSSIGELLAKFNPLIISLRISLIPLQLLAKALAYLTPIISDFLVPAFQSFTIILAEARNGIADFVNGITQSGLAKTLGLDIAKIGKVNIDELKKSFIASKEATKEATTEAEKNNEANKKQIVTIESLTEKIKKLTEERDKADVTDLKKINSLNAEIKKTEDLIKKLKGHDDATKELNKSRKEWEEMQKRAQTTMKFDPILNPDLTKDSAKKVHDARLKSMKDGQKIIQQEIKDQQEADKKILEGIQKREASIKQAKQIAKDFAVNAAGEVVDFVEASEERKAQTQIEKVNEAADAEILALEKRLAKGKITEEQFQAQKEAILKKAAQKEAAIKTKQAKDEKLFAIASIALNTAIAIVKGIAQFGPPPSPAGIAAIAAASITGALQAAFVAATPIPKFKDGVIDLKGPGTGTSDSITARLSRGESVMTAKETKDYRSELEAMRNGTFKYRLPVTRRQSLSEARHESMAENLTRSLSLQNTFDDQRIVNAVKDTKRSKEADTRLANLIGSRIGDKFSEDKLFK